MDLSSPPESASSSDGWNFGLYRGPIAVPDIDHNFGRWRLKEWSFTSFATPNFFGSVVVVQLGYVAYRAICLANNDGKLLFRDKELSPFGSALDFAPSSIAGTSEWKSRRATIEQGWNGKWTQAAWWNCGRGITTPTDSTPGR